ncbi:hypothetical protein E2K80_06870 [Rhodophyticola sp. CCM32]|uniref:hypothetical protein n=1 Tax=Rhodophyticola sp. CCM32 TaxID=2916397 RepID=UPI00107F80BD|nr:hypothetical protein [Rhodophyticola sp. CCM32]QBY00492.1 hypothetical protein E2K80_06870 [Rhodophyticola sp. CCM32]
MSLRVSIIMAGLAALTLGFAGARGETVDLTPPAEGSVSPAEGLDAWARIYEVTSHPRCSNCHVGADNTPMWSGPSYSRTRPHGMNINAGESRMGVEYIPCSTCHAYRAEGGNDRPHAAPQVAMDWRLAPVEAAWFGRSSAEICAQLRDPERNGNRDAADLAAHLGHDVILHWAWTPGGGREPAPHNLQDHVYDILAWGVAGYPCPQD